MPAASSAASAGRLGAPAGSSILAGYGSAYGGAGGSYTPGSGARPAGPAGGITPGPEAAALSTAASYIQRANQLAAQLPTTPVSGVAEAALRVRISHTGN